MLFTGRRFYRNRKGITLVEMVAAIAITAILASVLSMMIVPVMNTYRRTEVRNELQEAVAGRLEDIAVHLRSATGVYLSSTAKSFPDITKNSYQYEGIRHWDVKFGIANYNCYQGTSSSYLYPELKWANYSDVNNPTIEWASEYEPNLKLSSDVFQNKNISCPSAEDFYFLVRTNPDGGDHTNALEIHLKVKKGNVYFEGVKTIVCENLAINGLDIYKAVFDKDNKGKWKDLQKAEVSEGKDASKWKKYYSVWFSRDI